ncbi:hypothetical protein D9M73_132550 [compost metagenome]
MRHWLELDDDLRSAPRHAFAGAQIERHARPAPVVDVRLDGNESFGIAVVVDVLFKVVGRHFLAADTPGTILATYRLVLHILAGDWLEGAQDFHLFVAYRFCLELRGWLHGHQAQQLQQVVLQHVANSPGAIVVGTAVFYAQCLANADLDMVDLVVAPHRLQQGIGKTQGHQVLHGFLAQVVVDAEHLSFFEYRANGFIDGSGGFQGMADRFFQHDARFGVGQPGNAQVVGNWHEQVGGGGQVEDARQPAGFTQVACQAAKIGAL